MKCELEKMGDHLSAVELDLGVAAVAGQEAACGVL